MEAQKRSLQSAVGTLPMFSQKFQQALKIILGMCVVIVSGVKSNNAHTKSKELVLVFV